MEYADAHVLIIEDDANNLLITSDLLRLVGVKYVNARASGWQGLKLAESMHRLDLILLDIQLPGEDGYATLARIRASAKLRNVKVVALTANVLPQDEARAHAAGFDGFIGKPVDFDRFPEQIRALLSGEPVWVAR
jgi:two-component system, cell cycle response regulator DivK